MSQLKWVIHVGRIRGLAAAEAIGLGEGEHLLGGRVVDRAQRGVDVALTHRHTFISYY